ncbi:MAG: hypothetical protein ACI841_003228, partial [Planctomycetota bacterium]
MGRGEAGLVIIDSTPVPNRRTGIFAACHDPRNRRMDP